MKNEINFSVLWRVFTRAWVAILVFVIVAMLLAGLVTNYFMVKKYSSSITFYVINVAPDSEYVTTSLMQVVEHLSNDYIQIINSDVMLSPLCEFLANEHDVVYTPTQIRKMISTSITTGSSTFSLKVTNSNVDHAYIIAKYIAEKAPDIVKEYTSINSTPIIGSGAEDTEIEKMRVLNTPKLATTYDSPNLIINLLISALVTSVIVYALFLLKYMFNTTVATEEDIKNITDKYPIIGIIPKWE